VRVLEWGAGASTVYWPERCASVERWVAVESRPEYAEAVRAEIARRRLGGRVSCLHLEGEEYTTLPDLADVQFGLIIVDGIARVECLRSAAQRLAPRGIVVLHDAGRNSYRDGWDAFRRCEMLYPGEIPNGEDGYKHRGIAVLWNGQYVKRAGWLRDYA